MLYNYSHPCHAEGCDHPTHGPNACCFGGCHHHHCKLHRLAADHQCAQLTHKVESEMNQLAVIWSNEQKKAWVRLIIALDTSTVERQASSFRPGHTCTLKLPTEENHLSIWREDRKQSACNAHFVLEWDDGDRWLLRARYPYEELPPRSLLDQVAKSECATMRALNSAGLAVPDAWFPESSMAGTEPLYFFCTFVDGQAGLLSHRPNWHEVDEISPADRRFILEYAQFKIALSSVTYQGIGSLEFDPEGNIRVGPLISRNFFSQGGSPHFFGPFASQRERYLAHIDFILDNIRRGCFYETDPVAAYLIHSELRHIASTCQALDRVGGDTYVKHADDNASQYFFLDGDMRAAIDWEWAYTTTKHDAFGTNVQFVDWAAFNTGSNSLSLPETHLVETYKSLGRPDLAECVLQGRLYQRFDELVGQLCRPNTYDIDGIVTLKSVSALQRATFGGDESALEPDITWVEWLSQAAERYKGDVGLAMVCERWEQDKRAVELMRLSIQEKIDRRVEEEEARLSAEST